MAHDRLFPRTGHKWLSPPEVVERLRSEFSTVKVDRKQGEAHVVRMIDQLTRMLHLTPPPASEAEIDRLRSVREQAVFLMFGESTDSDNGYLGTTVIPGEPLFFGYSSGRHQEATRPLLERCASALGYEIEGPEREADGM